MAFSRTLVATILILAIARVTGATSANRHPLLGVAVSFFIMAGANVLFFLGIKPPTRVVFRMLGGVGLAQWSHLIYPLVVPLPAAFWLWTQGRASTPCRWTRPLRPLGIPIAQFIAVFVAPALVTGIMVAFSGLFGFVGTMMPHLARLVVGGDTTRVLPLSALAGAIFLVLADTVARIATAPEGMPISVATGLVGGMFFRWLMARKP